MKNYCYLFTRQDISPEQQVVQTAHAAMKLGYLAHDNMVPLDPDNTYFTVVGVRNEEALYAVVKLLNKFEYSFEVFVEPDIGGQVTSIATYPINENNRGPLLAFNLLKMK